MNFYTREYVTAHNKQPRGRGSWAFCPLDRYTGVDYMTFVVWFNGTYTEAKKQAAVHFKAAGIRNVVVCS